MHYTAPYLPETAPFTEEQRAWLNGFFAGMAAPEPPVLPLPLTSGDGHLAEPVIAEPKAPVFDRNHPFPARLVTNRRLNGDGSAKDTRHLEIALDGSGLTYEVGDALGIVPCNCLELVNGLLRVLGFSGEEPVTLTSGGEVPIREAFRTHVEIATPSRVFLEALAERTGDDALHAMLRPEGREALATFLWGRDLIDLMEDWPGVAWTPASFVATLRPLQHRLYSIASSLKAHPEQVHLTVGAVRYTVRGRMRKGVCSTFLADRVAEDTPVPVFVHRNRTFRLPGDPATPIIMIGPGTGIAPFRAFLYERRATGATGKNWLFFGDQHAATDFLYRSELEAMQQDGTLTWLDTAFSRDQAEKVYVQHRMLAEADRFFGWLEDGAHVYVCGDASRMAKDVDAALHRIVEQAGGMSVEESAAYVRDLRKAKRYARDVY